jgi:flagellar protein FlgJ
MAAEIQSALTMARSTPLQAPHAGATPEATKKAAKDFEAVFVSEFLGSMFEGIQTDGMFGGGQGEQIFRSMMLDQYGHQIASQGGFGIADSVTRSLVQHQETQQRARQAQIDAASGTKPKTQEPIPVTKSKPTYSAHPAAPTAFPLKPRTAPVFAAHPQGISVSL